MTPAHDQNARPARKPRIWALLAFALPVLAVLLALGTWQVERLAWKQGLIATIDARTHMAPIDLRTLLGSNPDVAAQEYRPVTVSGTFDHAGERYFLATHDGESGFFVYTPLRLDDGSIVFVNRGFVPYDRRNPSTRTAGQVQGIVTVSGLLRSSLSAKPSWIVPDNDPAKNVFYWKDLRAMSASAGLPADAKVLDLFVDADATPNPGGLPIGAVTLIDLPNSHLQYAVTWYGLAAALVLIVAVIAFRLKEERH